MGFIEDAWSPIIGLLAVAVFFAGSWYARPRKAPLIGVLAALAACVAVWLVERQVVTPAEEVERDVMGMVDACQRGNIEETVAFISPQAVGWRAAVAAAMALVDVQDDVRVTDMRVQVRAGGTMAVSRFRANATVRTSGPIEYTGRHPSRWELTWQKVGDQWKVIEIRRLSVVGDRELQLLERSE